MRCPRCGNDNPGTNRFCGMCGATLLQTPAPVAAGPTQGTAATDSANLQAAIPPARQESGLRPASSSGPPSNSGSGAADTGSSSRAASNGDEPPVISGPSFLGLNQRSPHPAYSSGRRHSSLSIDPRTSSGSRNLDYLLEDDESSGGGALKFVLIFVALVLAIGLGYLRWKNEGLAWLTSVTKKPSAATQPVQDSNAPAPNSSNAPNTAPAVTPPAQPAPSQPAANSSPAPGATTTPGATPASPSSASTSTSEPSSAAPAASQPSTNSPGANQETSSSPAASSLPAAGDASNSGSDANSAAAQPEKKEASEDASEAPAKPEKTKPKPSAAPAKPTAARPLVMGDPVAEAQRYLYGKGASQDCDRGLRILKPAAQAANPKAMVEMGALYSAGLCTPRDLPTAYRWFAMALRKDPDNQAIQTDLQKLWGEMTQPERQLAIRLTQ